MAIQLIFRSSEVRLMEFLNNIHEPAGWHGVHFHLDKLLEQYKSEYQIKIAINLIHDLLKHYDGTVFLMSDQSIIVLCYGLEKTLRNKLIFQLRYLYMDDPIAYTEDGRESPDFSTSYDLGREWNAFFDACSQRMARSIRKVGPQSDDFSLPVKAASSGMSASRLVTIERDLESADITKVLRRQPVCAVMPDMTIRRVFDELYIHISHLRQLLKSDVDFLSNRWLFKYITQQLDHRVVDLIRNNIANYLSTPISINLNAESILTDWFTQFDSLISPALKLSMVIEVPVVDVFADMTAFMAAKNEAQRLGYRVCLDGLSTRSFLHINRERLGLDLMKVQWNADSRYDLNSEENRMLAAAIRESGTNRIILCRCDDRHAIEYGQALGISLYQGRYIDSMFNPTAKIEN